MAGLKTTLYLNSKILRVLKVKSELTKQSISDLVNEALIHSLREDLVDLESFQKRAKEPSRSLKRIFKELKRDGLL